MTVETIAFIIALVLMSITVLLGWLLLREIKNQQTVITYRRRRPIRFPRFRKTPSPEIQRLQQQLILMLCGDRETAHRMVNYERYQNRGRTEAWYWQAAIDRLIRDRR